MPRDRDLIFEAICTACGLDWNDLTKTERSRVNQARKELADKPPAEIIRRGAVANDLLRPPAFVTPQTLTKMWTRLGEADTSEDRSRQYRSNRSGLL